MLSNPPNAPVVVQKYGGTSVGKFLETIVDDIIPSFLKKNNRLVLVCSARSGNTKETGTTNLLLRAAKEALDPVPTNLKHSILSAPRTPPASNSPPCFTPLSAESQSPVSPSSSGTDSPVYYYSNSNSTVDRIRNDHLSSARGLIRDPEILASLELSINQDCENLRNFLWATRIINEISSRSKDIIIGTGEKLSCRIVSALLRDRGIDSELVVLDNIVESILKENASNSNQTLGQDFYNRLARKLGQRLRDCQDRVPVVTGYFGVVPGSLLLQVGRGYTDLCAALCAVGLKASELQVWKEVDGIFTADPRKVPTARLLSIITPEEAAELTYYGSEVIHPFTMEQVIKASIPIRIKNVENPSGHGTIIYPDSPSSLSSSSSTSLSYASKMTAGTETPPVVREERTSLSLNSSFLKDVNAATRIPTAVTIKDHITVLNIRSNRKTISHGFFAQIFSTLDKFNIVVDLIATSETSISMAINEDTYDSLEESLREELEQLGEVSARKDMAILSLVGKNMKNKIGIAGKMFTVLGHGEVNIEVISQGASEINTSCVINKTQADIALRLVHDNLLSL